MADYIDRNEAIAALTEFRDDQTVSKYVSVENCMVARGAIERTTKVLESLPAADVEPVQEWISVKDRLPEAFVSVLVHMPGEEPCPTVREGFISNDGIWQSAMFRREPGEVTHWQPMPQPPKGE